MPSQPSARSRMHLIACGSDRPAAPVTAYLVGIAVGQGRPLPQAIKCIRDLADGWEGRSEES